VVPSERSGYGRTPKLGGKPVVLLKRPEQRGCRLGIIQGLAQDGIDVFWTCWPKSRVEEFEAQALVIDRAVRVMISRNAKYVLRRASAHLTQRFEPLKGDIKLRFAASERDVAAQDDALEWDADEYSQPLDIKLQLVAQVRVQVVAIVFAVLGFAKMDVGQVEEPLQPKGFNVRTAHRGMLPSYAAVVNRSK
jgi:hypothetical protein